MHLKDSCPYGIREYVSEAGTRLQQPTPLTLPVDKSKCLQVCSSHVDHRN